MKKVNQTQFYLITMPNFWKVCVILFFSLIITQCSSDDDDSSTSTDSSTGGTSTEVSISDSNTSADAVGSSETAYDEDDLIENSTFSNTVTITFSGDTATVDNPLDGNGVTVTQSDGDVTVESTVSEVEYLLTGTTTDGSFKIYSEKKFKLTLDGVTLTNSDGPAINIQSSKRVFVVLNDGTTNTLEDSSTYSVPDDEDAKATLFSEGQLVFSGTGSLTATSNYKHGICSDDYVRIIEGTITVASAASDGIHANDAIIVDGGTLNITASSDGIDCEEGYIVINDGTFTINAVDDGIAASYDTDDTIDPYIVINGGTFAITTTEGEGIESKSTLTINDGTIEIDAYDDAINAIATLNVNGGQIYAASSSNDGIDSNGTIAITGGYTIAVGSSAPEAGIDTDNGTFEITGGTLLGIGGSTNLPTSGSTQNSVMLGSGSANQIIHIESTSGNEALTFKAPKSYSTMLYSSVKLETGDTYTVYTGGSVSGGSDFNGLYTSGTYTGGTKSNTSFTISSLVTRVGGTVGP